MFDDLTKKEAARIMEWHGYHYPSSYSFTADGELQALESYSDGTGEWKVIPLRQSKIREFLGY